PTDRKIDWAIIDEELHTLANEQARDEGAFLYGRRLYQVMADYWPTADVKPSAPSFEVEFARIWQAKPKVVFSTTLDRVEWKSRLVREKIAEEMTRLQAQPGEHPTVGGATLASAAIRLGLGDEFRPIV